MYNLTYFDFVRELNKGMVINGNKIVSTGTEDQLNARKELLENYTFVVLAEESPIIGVKTITVIEQENIIPRITINFLSNYDNRLLAHTDVSVVSNSTLMVYSDIRQSIFNWLNGQGTFDDFMFKYQTRVVKTNE